MLNPDFRDMLSALSEEGAEFLVVGSYALAAHGHPRTTGDIGRADLLANKKALGRPQDRADVARLEESA